MESKAMVFFICTMNLVSAAVEEKVFDGLAASLAAAAQVVLFHGGAMQECTKPSCPGVSCEAKAEGT